MNWLGCSVDDEKKWERAVALQRLVEALEASVIDTGLTLLDQALENAYTELSSEALPHNSREEQAALLIARMRPLLAQLDQQRATLVFKLRVLANAEGQVGVKMPPEPLFGGAGYTWD